MMPNFNDATISALPFPHLRVAEILRRDDADRVLSWLRKFAPWKLTVADFYEQYEFSLLGSDLAPGLDRLVRLDFVEALSVELAHYFGIGGKLELVDVTAHKLTQGQTIRIHNDFLGSEETHRVLIQLNNGWEASQGPANAF